MSKTVLTVDDSRTMRDMLLLALQASVAQFRVGDTASVVRAHAPAPRPAMAPAPARPAEPPRSSRMIQALKTIGRGGAAPKVEAVEDGWEEF